jgi:hypothetical protein
MRGINYRSLNEKWISIIDKLCDEKTPHDVLGVVVDHLKATKVITEKMGYKSENLAHGIRELERGIMHIKLGMKHIDPEG